MTDGEWTAVMAALVGSWPDADPLSSDVERFWRDQLDGLTATQVLATVRSLMRDGERFRPVVGQIYRRALDLSNDAPDWPTVWREIRRAATT